MRIRPSAFVLIIERYIGFSCTRNIIMYISALLSSDLQKMKYLLDQETLYVVAILVGYYLDMFISEYIPRAMAK